MEKSIFEKPESAQVALGGHLHRIFEIRPRDLIAVKEFMAAMEDGPAKETDKTLDGTSFLSEIPQKAMELWISKPEAICKLLAIILDPDPGNPESDFVEKHTKAFYKLPISELNKALEAWMKVNSFFLADMLTPLISGITYLVLEQAEKTLRELQSLNQDSSTNGKGSLLA